MKKSMLLGLSLALISFVACVRGPEEDLPQAKIILTAKTESPAETRTVVMETEGETVAKVYWEPGDSFMAYSGTQRGDFYAQVSKVCETAEFWGYFEKGPWVSGMDMWAVYPWNWDTSFEDGVFTTVLPFRQEARPGTFGRDANLAIAHTNSNTIQFYNVGGGVRFSVQEEGIQEVILQGLDGEVLAGKIQVGFQNEVPVVLDVVEGKQAIMLTAPYGQTFAKDNWYYIVAVPGALEKGFVLDFFKEDTHGGRVFDKSVTIKRSIYGTVTHADEGVSYTPCANGIISFKDEKVRSILASHFDVNGDGMISVREAAIVRSFLVKKAQTRAEAEKVSIFAGTDITSFNELVYFTSLNRIEEGTFAGCEQLKSITIPETVTAIGANAFNGCTGLQSILVLSPTPPAIGTDAFANSGDCPISVPEDVVDQYVSAWSEYAPRIKAAEEPVYPTPEAVDLGLPSGTRWASFNLGASKPEEYGDYFAWGETVTKSVFSWPSYKWYKKEGNAQGLTKYCPDASMGFNGFKDDKWLLDPEDDVAHVKLGENWRMPTAGDWDELARLCTLDWVSLGGVNCAKLTGPNGNSIILPPGGGAGDDSALEAIGQVGAYWSSAGAFADEVGVWVFGFYSDMDEDDYDIPYPDRCLLLSLDIPRAFGIPVRPVSGPAPVFAESLSLDKSELSLKSGETATLHASILPENTTHQSLLWISDDDRIATVSSTGEVKAVGIGETIIYAVIMDGTKMAQCTVKVGMPEAVDLGLPSGIKWASFNLGSYPYGDYYAWGETAPYYESGDAQSDSPRWKRTWNEYTYREINYANGGYCWESYMFSRVWQDEDGVDHMSGILKYSDEDGLYMLLSEDDAAQRLLKGGWRMPSWAEMNELRSLCTWEWTTQDGINGQKVTGPNGNSIFLPAAGDRYGLNLGYFGGDGLYWTSSRSSSSYAIGMDFDVDGVYTVSGYSRYYGFSIRPVYGTVPVPVESLAVDKTEIVIRVGETVDANVTLLPANATFGAYALTVSNSSRVTMSRTQSGFSVTGVAPGHARITALSYDGGKAAICEITVLDPMDDLIGTYRFTSSIYAFTDNPWTVEISKDENDRQKVWFYNLCASPDWAGDDILYYGNVDESVSTIEIPFGQQSAYLFEGETPIKLCWVNQEGNTGDTGSVTVTIQKDESGKIIGLDFGESYGFGGCLADDSNRWIGYAFPRVTGEKQTTTSTSVKAKQTSPRRGEILTGKLSRP